MWLDVGLHLCLHLVQEQLLAVRCRGALSAFGDVGEVGGEGKSNLTLTVQISRTIFDADWVCVDDEWLELTD